MIHSYATVFQLGHKMIADIFTSPVVVEEKIDGSSFSFGIIDGELQCRSKGKQLILDAPEKMFTKAVATAQELSSLLHPGWVYRGEYLCLSGDTKVKKASAGQNKKYLTLKELYYLQNKLVDNGYRNKGIRKMKPRNPNTQSTRWKKDGYPRLYSLDINTDKIIQNRILKIICSGIKDVFKITVRKGFSIKTTREHLFWTPYGWVPASNLRINDCVGILDSTFYKIEKQSFPKEKTLLFESLKKGACCELCGTKTCLEIHHIDQNNSNDCLENLQVLCQDCHLRITRKSHRKIEDYEFDKIINIEYIGEEECYDVEMQGDEKTASLVAEGFIVHNCKPHHNVLAYERVPLKNIIIFDIDTGGENYLSLEEKMDEAHRLGLECVSCFHVGMLESYENFVHLLEMTSRLGGTRIEGIVIKNYNLFTAEKKIAIGKYVSERFKEVAGGEWRKINPSVTDYVNQLIASYRTHARWEKAVQHLRERGELEESPRDIGKLIHEVPEDVLRECELEIKERLFTHFWPKIRRGVTVGLPEFYKEELLRKGFTEESKDAM